MRAALCIGLLTLALPAATLAQPGSYNPVDQRVGASFNAAQSLQGPLDGAWTLVSGAGQPIIAFQLVDRPGARDPVEGVWRDLRKPAAPGDIGFVDSVVRGPDGLSIQLNATARSPAVSISLRTDPSGAWAGTMRESGADVPVKLRRN